MMSRTSRSLVQLLIAASLSLASCGDPDDGDVSDKDAALTCAADAECAAGERCLSGEGGAGKVCRAPASCAEALDQDSFCEMGEICDTASSSCVMWTGCRVDASCAIGERCFRDDATRTGTCRLPVGCAEQADPERYCATLGAGFVCDPAQGRCVQGGGGGFRYVMIQDVSSGDASCMSQTAAGYADAGSDIIAVEVLSEGGDVYGSARAISYVQGAGAVDCNDFTIFNGEKVMLDQDACPSAVLGERFNPGTVLTLGCGGQLFVEFATAPDGAALALQSEMVIFVSEYAPICNQNGGDVMGADRYRISLCELPAGKPADQIDEGDCLFPLLSPTGGASYTSIP